MTELTLHGRRITSVFELLGTKENDITAALGWALAESPILLRAVVQRAMGRECSVEDARVALQTHSDAGGFTDIEILGSEFHVIVEAKRGWWFPGDDQLRKYAARFAREDGAFLVASESSEAYAAAHLPPEILGHEVRHLGWGELASIAHAPDGTNAEKRLLAELRRYLASFIRMQDQRDNRAYVVVLGHDTPDWSRLSWRAIVNDRHTYFHPVGGSGWPKSPPNYLAFRYDGRLQSIHHVEAVRVTSDRGDAMPELTPGEWGPHFVYTLGPAILPPHEVRTGKIYPNGRVWAALALLLTCETVADARDATKLREV